MAKVETTRRNLRLAAEHRERAVAERALADELQRTGALEQAERHLIDAVLHDGRADAFEAAAREGRAAPAGTRPRPGPASR